VASFLFLLPPHQTGECRGTVETPNMSLEPQLPSAPEQRALEEIMRHAITTSFILAAAFGSGPTSAQTAPPFPQLKEHFDASLNPAENGRLDEDDDVATQSCRLCSRQSERGHDPGPIQELGLGCTHRNLQSAFPHARPPGRVLPSRSLPCW
jgi:hypothetical protein